MSVDVEWGPWVDHDGLSIPPDVPGAYAQAQGHLFAWGIITVAQGRIRTGKAWVSRHPLHGSEIISYRIRKPRALLDLITLAADPYAPPPVIGPDSPVRMPEGVPA